MMTQHQIELAHKALLELNDGIERAEAQGDVHDAVAEFASNEKQARQHQRLAFKARQSAQSMTEAHGAISDLLMLEV